MGAAFKATVKAEASNAHAACRNAHKAYEILKKDVASNVSTRKQVYIASKVITCYIDNLSNNGGAKGCADRARRANTSRWNISAPKMNACLSKVALEAQQAQLPRQPLERARHQGARHQGASVQGAQLQGAQQQGAQQQGARQQGAHQQGARQ